MPVASSSSLKIWSHRLGGVVLFLSGAALGAWGWQHYMITPAVDNDPNLQAVVDAWSLAKTRYIKPVDTIVMRDAALAGMAQSLDPHSEWWSPKNQALIQNELSGEYGGVGIRFDWEAHAAHVVAVQDGGPAQQVGMKEGDRIVAVNGQPISQQTTPASVWRGKPGSTVAMTVERTEHGTTVKHTWTLTRALIHGFEVEDEVQPLNGEPWLRLHVQAFQDSTASEVAALLRQRWSAAQAAGRPFKGVVLDLRGSPGGLVTTSIELASLWLPPREPVVTLHERDGDTVMKTVAFQPEVWSSWLKSAPLVLWTDGATASAAEILVGALRDHGRSAWVIGESTFGKGSVQTAIPLVPNGAFKITTGLYTTPDGSYLQRVGEVPDLTLMPQDPATMLTYTSERSLPGALVLPKTDPVPHSKAGATVSLPNSAWSRGEARTPWYWAATEQALAASSTAQGWNGTSLSAFHALKDSDVRTFSSFADAPASEPLAHSDKTP